MNAEYAELHCLSNFSFQRGASSASELFERAKRQGYDALAITDECSLAGIVRAWQASKDTGLPLIIGSEVQIEGGPKLVLLVENLTGYQALCQLITRAPRRAEKGRYQALREDLSEWPLEGLLAIWLPAHTGADAEGQWLRERFPERLWLGIELHRGPDDALQLRQSLAQASRLGIPAVACGDVHMHARGRRALQDCMTSATICQWPKQDVTYLPMANATSDRSSNWPSSIQPSCSLKPFASVSAAISSSTS